MQGEICLKVVYLGVSGLAGIWFMRYDDPESTFPEVYRPCTFLSCSGSDNPQPCLGARRAYAKIVQASYVPQLIDFVNPIFSPARNARAL